ncbi:MAG: hypothetical protein CM1200mP18_11270 [Gammaproteobacteria bacterium]|nr:MAG: hypothetical protein CM1200mP18_11270 [Gammaproteobacteria bacterium]
MPPSGVPVCLTEKTKGCHCVGVCLAKILEPAGLSGPVPRPTRTAAKSLPAKKAEHWLARGQALPQTRQPGRSE